MEIIKFYNTFPFLFECGWSKTCDKMFELKTLTYPTVLRIELLVCLFFSNCWEKEHAKKYKKKVNFKFLYWFDDKVELCTDFISFWRRDRRHNVDVLRVRGSKYNSHIRVHPISNSNVIHSKLLWQPSNFSDIKINFSTRQST